MGRKRSMGINAVLSGVKTMLSVVFPLITFPYISRVLTVDNVGKYNFATSVMTYVSLFAALGINTYAIRECSKVRDDKSLLDATASEIYTINVISTILSYGVLAALLLFVPFFDSYRLVIAILSINVVFTTIGCEWIYAAYENYLYITIRSLLTHIVSLVLLFVMVRESDDIIPYAVVTVIGTSGGNLFYMLGRKNYANISIRVTSGIKRHIKPIMTMFANTVTTSIYVNSDIIILEMLTSDRIVGLYSASTKIYTIIKNVLAAVITVSVPRLSSYWERRDIRNYNATCYKVFMVFLLMGAPAMVGLASLSRYVILLVSSSKYAEATGSLQILSIALLFSIFAWFYKSCVLIPTGNEEKILKATVIASVVNIVLNFILIPAWGQNAAALTTLLAELICLGVAYHYGKKYCGFKVKVRDCISVVIGCIFIFAVCRLIPGIVSGTLAIVFLSMCISVIGYAVILVLARNSVAVFLMNVAMKKINSKRR